jgi:hypothetical protein
MLVLLLSRLGITGCVMRIAENPRRQLCYPENVNHSNTKIFQPNCTIIRHVHHNPLLSKGGVLHVSLYSSSLDRESRGHSIFPFFLPNIHRTLMPTLEHSTHHQQPKWSLPVSNPNSGPVMVKPSISPLSSRL